MLISALFTIDKTWKQPKCPLTDTEDVACIHTCTMEYYSAIEKKIMPFAATWLKLKVIELTELSHTKTNVTWYGLGTKCKKKKNYRNELTSKWKQTRRLRKQAHG